MIHQHLTLEKFDNWEVDIYYGVTHWEVDEIMVRLHEIGCDAMTARKAYDNMTSNNLNTGLTYSNFRKGKSVMVIGVSENREQFANTLTHEQLHLVAHISKVYYIDMYGEEICYLIGDIAQRMYRISKDFLCECCSKELKYRYEKEIKQDKYY